MKMMMRIGDRANGRTPSPTLYLCSCLYLYSCTTRGAVVESRPPLGSGGAPAGR